jgi:hypothetical protein
MTRSDGFARVSLSSARWLLPWIAVLFVSATLAYAMSSAVHRGTSPGDQQPDVRGRYRQAKPPPRRHSSPQRQRVRYVSEAGCLPWHGALLGKRG